MNPIRSFLTLILAIVTSIGLSAPLVATAQDDLNCDDFNSRSAAQAVYDADPNDPNRLDGADQDGDVCERFDYGIVTVDLTDADIDAIVSGVVAGVLEGQATPEETPVPDPVDPPASPDLGITEDGYSVVGLTALAEYLDGPGD